MKYFPLVWAALWRKPTRMILTLLSVTVAFTLFGMMVGFNASVQHLIETSQLDRGYVDPRFGGNLPLAYKDQIARISGVTKVSYLGVIRGYYQDRKKSVFPLMYDGEARYTMTDFQLTPAQWDQMAQTRDGVFVSQSTASRFHLKAGGTFPVLSPGTPRQDGSKLWTFTVLGVVDDVPRYTNGFVIGNFDYLDQSRPLAQRGTVDGYQIKFTSADRAETGVKDIDTLFANSGAPTTSITEKDSAESAAAAGINIPFVTTVVATAGLFMILFLTGNGIAQSVRERIPEFAVLKTLGFSDGSVMALVFVEAAIPCLLGAAIGIGLATVMAKQVPHLFPPNVLALPAPYMSPAVLSLAFVFAVLVAFASAVIPAWRIKQLDVATALARR